MLGAGLRLYAIWFGLPYLRARPDEIDAVMHGQMVMRGDLNPHFFHWPSADVLHLRRRVYGRVGCARCPDSRRDRQRRPVSLPGPHRRRARGHGDHRGPLRPGPARRRRVDRHCGRDVSRCRDSPRARVALRHDRRAHDAARDGVAGAARPRSRRG